MSQIQEERRELAYCFIFAAEKKGQDLGIPYDRMADDPAEVAFQVSSPSFNKVVAKSPSVLFIWKWW